MNVKKTSLFVLLCLTTQHNACAGHTGALNTYQEQEGYAWQLNLIPAAFLGTVTYILGGWAYQYYNRNSLKNCRRKTQDVVDNAQRYSNFAHALTRQGITPTSTEEELVAFSEYLLRRNILLFPIYDLECSLKATQSQQRTTQEWYEFALEKDWISQQMATALQQDISLLHKQAHILEKLISTAKPHTHFFALHSQLKYIEERYVDELNVILNEPHWFYREQLTALLTTQANTHHHAKYPLLTYTDQLEKILQELRRLYKQATRYPQTQRAAHKIGENLTLMCSIIQQSPLYAQQIQQKKEDQRFEELQSKLRKLEQNQQRLMLQNARLQNELSCKS